MNAELVKQKDQILYWMYDYIEDDEDDPDIAESSMRLLQGWEWGVSLGIAF